MKFRHFLPTLIGSILVLAATAGIGWGLLAYKSRQIEAKKNQPPPPEVVESVGIVNVEETEFQLSTTTIGTIVAPKWMTLRTEASGRVTAVHIESGELVKEGQILIELDSSVETASRKAAEAKLQMATSALKRFSTLSESGAISSQELEQSQFDKDSAEAEIERLNAIIDRRTLKAPYDARVGLINLSVGQYLLEGVELTTLTGTGDDMYVDFAIPQSISSFIHKNQTVRVDAKGEQLEATVIAVDTRSDRITRNLMIRAECKVPEQRLSPNDSVNVFVEYGPKLKGAVIPSSAILRSPEGSYVYTVITDEQGVDRAVQRFIKTSQSIGNLVVVQEGLSVGDRIVSQGAFKLRPNLAVRETLLDSASATSVDGGS
ncbi:MAG: efflux RND transporter periplasmic adaptor subunit [Pirellula sp.]|jgi:membrane fusion protein (multidrug efflux system)|nr:efflux RND transporter periplasmic adaptor subunit [Pirellula sp.]